MKEIQSLSNRLEHGSSINEIMGIEGNIRKIYYSTWNDLIKQDIKFEKKNKKTTR